jgi:hypothetical protein
VIAVAVQPFVAVGVLVAVGVAPPLTVIVNVVVLLDPQELVYVAVKLLLPELSGMLSISREVELKPFGPLQLHEPPLDGCGPMSTAVPELTLMLVICCQPPALVQI